MRAIAAVLILFALSANAEFSGSTTSPTSPVPTSAEVSDCVTCNDWVLVSECPKYMTEVEVEVPVIVEVPYIVEVPVYIPEGSSAAWDSVSQVLYLYEIDIYEGPRRTGEFVPFAALKYKEELDFELIDLQ